eukprot:snap_masked-scaffold_60-processed-gene-0.8-mRNA-1 protein AED:1.00 eAED:1.00 QI:0/0/0/0/1/1/2/0/76
MILMKLISKQEADTSVKLNSSSTIWIEASLDVDTSVGSIENQKNIAIPNTTFELAIMHVQYYFALEHHLHHEFNQN